MKIKEIEFFPKEGERNSPEDSLQNICSEDEQASILGKLEKLLEIPKNNWPYKWSKPVKEFNQLTQGDFRTLYKIVQEKIIVLHIFRKVGNKTKKKDIDIARANLYDYLEE